MMLQKNQIGKKRAKRALITNLFPLAGAALYGAENIEEQKGQK